MMPLSWITTLFQRFHGIWTDKWARAMPSAEIMESAKLDWQQALAGFSADQIRAGIEKARLEEWPVSIGQFVKLCKPDVVAAHQDALPMLEERRNFKATRSPESEAAFEEVRRKLKNYTK